MSQSKLFAHALDTTTLIITISIFSFSAMQIASSNQSVHLDVTISRNSIRIQTTIHGDRQNALCNEAV